MVLAYWLGVDRRCNLTALATAQGLVLIDSEMSPRIMAPIKHRLEQHFARTDWACVINTHAHDNHAGGNALFPAATLVGHAHLAADMQWLLRRQTDPAWKQRELDAMSTTIRNCRTLLARTTRRTDARRLQGEIRFWELHTQDLREGYPIVPPALTFADRHTLDLGDLTLELIFFGRGHSNSDILIYIPQEKLLVSGAVFYQRNHLPEIGETTDRQDLDRFFATLDHLLAPATEIDRIIPSHSPPLRKSDLKPVRDYYQTMLTEVEKARRDGLTLDQTIQRLTVRAKFPHHGPTSRPLGPRHAAAQRLQPVAHPGRRIGAEALGGRCGLSGLSGPGGREDSAFPVRVAASRPEALGMVLGSFSGRPSAEQARAAGFRCGGGRAAR